MGPKGDREDGPDWMRDEKTVRLRVEEVESRQVMEIDGMKPRCKRSGGEWDRKRFNDANPEDGKRRGYRRRANLADSARGIAHRRNVLRKTPILLGVEHPVRSVAGNGWIE